MTLTAVDGSNWEASLCALAHVPARAQFAHLTRRLDDIVGNGNGNSDGHTTHKLEVWRQRLTHPAQIEREPLALAWSATRHGFHISALYAEQLIDGVRYDLTQGVEAVPHAPAAR